MSGRELCMPGLAGQVWAEQIRPRYHWRNWRAGLPPLGFVAVRQAVKPPRSSSRPPSLMQLQPVNSSVTNNTKKSSGFRLVLWCEPDRQNRTGWCRAARSFPAPGTTSTWRRRRRRRRTSGTRRINYTR